MRRPLNLATWVLRIASNAVVLALPGLVLGSTVGVIGAAVGAALGALHAWAITSTCCYAVEAKSWLTLLIDNTWSAVNSLVGSAFLGYGFMRGNELDQDRCAGRGSLVMRGEAIRGYATTLGPVEAGTTDDLAAHEAVHVLQARIFGPFFYPLVGLSYVVCTVLPYWLLYHDHAKWPIRDLRTYFTHGVYPHTWHEEWAYRV